MNEEDEKSAKGIALSISDDGVIMGFDFDLEDEDYQEPLESVE